MTKDAPRKAWGSGRIAVLARLETIRSELGQGLPLTTIYDRHKAAIGIGYASFCKLIDRYAGDAKISPRHAGTRPRISDRSPAPSCGPAATTRATLSSPPTPEGEWTRARHESRPRTFVYDGNPRQDDKVRLVGRGARDQKD